MPWEQSINNKTPEQLDQSAQAGRDQVISNYTKQLDDLEQKIMAARIELEGLNKDINNVHADRLNLYSDRDKVLKEIKDGLNDYAKSLDDQGQEINQKQDELNKNIGEHEAKIIADNQALSTREANAVSVNDDLNNRLGELATQHSDLLNAQQAMEDKKKENQETFKSIVDAQAKVDEDRQALEAAKADHADQVAVHQDNVTAFEKEKDRIMEFYHAVKAKEDALPQTQNAAVVEEVPAVETTKES